MTDQPCQTINCYVARQCTCLLNMSDIVTDNVLHFAITIVLVILDTAEIYSLSGHVVSFKWILYTTKEQPKSKTIWHSMTLKQRNVFDKAA